MQVWNVLHAKKSPKKSPSGHHRTTLSGYIFATKARIDNREKIIKQQYLIYCPHNMVNFSLLAAEIVSLVWGTPANFNGFRVLASLLQRRRSTEANQTLHSDWPLPGLVDYIYNFGGCCSVTEFCHFQNSLCVLHVLRSRIGSVTARQSSSRREPNFAGLTTGRHLYSAGRPSRWALAHIIVCLFIYSFIYSTSSTTDFPWAMRCGEWTEAANFNLHTAWYGVLVCTLWFIKTWHNSGKPLRIVII